MVLAGKDVDSIAENLHLLNGNESIREFYDDDQAVSYLREIGLMCDDNQVGLRI